MISKRRLLGAYNKKKKASPPLTHSRLHKYSVPWQCTFGVKYHTVGIHFILCSLAAGILATYFIDLPFLKRRYFWRKVILPLFWNLPCKNILCANDIKTWTVLSMKNISYWCVTLVYHMAICIYYSVTWYWIVLSLLNFSKRIKKQKKNNIIPQYYKLSEHFQGFNTLCCFWLTLVTFRRWSSRSLGLHLLCGKIHMPVSGYHFSFLFGRGIELISLTTFLFDIALFHEFFITAFFSFVRLSVWDEDSLGHNDFIGEYLLPLKKLPLNETKSYSVFLQDQVRKIKKDLNGIMSCWWGSCKEVLCLLTTIALWMSSLYVM